MYADLHIHSNYSDSTANIDEIIKAAVDKNIKVISITDHDTIEGIKPIIARIKELGVDLTIVPGVEVTTTEFVNGKFVGAHILVYDFDLDSPYINELLEKNNKVRGNMLENSVGRAYDQGKINKTWDEIKEENSFTSNIYVPHIYKSVVGEKLTYEKLIKFKKDNLTFDKIEYCSIKEVVDAARLSGGFSVFAHPKRVCKGDNEVFDFVIDSGVEGIEVKYPNHEEEDVEKYMKVVNERGLKVTGGTDWHHEFTPSFWPTIGHSGLTEEETIKLLDKEIEAIELN